MESILEKISTKVFTPFIFIVMLFSTLNLFAQCPEGDELVFKTQIEVDSFLIQYPNCIDLVGSIKIEGLGDTEPQITNLTAFQNIISIDGNLTIRFNDQLIDLAGFSNLTSINGNLTIDANELLINLQGLNNLSTITRKLWIRGNDNLETLNGLENITSIPFTEPATVVIRFNENLISLSGLENLTTIGNELFIEFNDRLPNLTGLTNLTTVTEFTVDKNNLMTSLTGVDNLSNVDRIYLKENESLSSLAGFENINSLSVLEMWGNHALESLEGFNNLNHIGNLRLFANFGLTDISAFNNVQTGNDWQIFNNTALSFCGESFLCNAFANEIIDITIGANNAEGCRSIEEIILDCDNIGSSRSFSFYDLNANGLQEADEPIINIGSIQIEPGNFTVLTNGNSGAFKLLELGNYTVTFNPIDNWQLTTPAVNNISLTSTNQNDTTYFGVTPITNNSDVTTSILNNNSRCNQFVRFFITATNQGTTFADGTLSFTHAESVTDVEIIDQPDLITSPNTYSWNFTGLLPGHSITKIINLELPGPPETEIGESILFNAEVNYSDANGTHNSIQEPLNFIVECAFDPNDKLVQPVYPENYALIGENLTYTVRFQNTGNAEAYVVEIQDEIDDNLDLSTFRYISSSHEEVLSTFLEDRTLTFQFNDIFLPDSTTNFDGSQGYVTYSIAPFSDIPEFTIIENTADIYFDNNPPVITNTTQNNMVLTFDHDADESMLWDDCDDYNAAISPHVEEIPNNNIDEDCDGVALIIDADGDGFNSDEDCDDTNNAINPDATEIANNDIDENCDGEVLIIDADGDGYNSDEDCDDTNSAINPGAPEIANNDIDENCDGVDQIIDADGDGYNSNEDCDDSNSQINPDATEIANNNIDENCDGELLIIDVDQDGYNSDEDCDDNNPDINPGMEEIVNNDIDEDCNGEVTIIDVDGDGFNSDEDCDDNNELINPNAEEIPGNDIDEDCDGLDGAVATNDLSSFNITIAPNPFVDELFLTNTTNQSFDYQLLDITGKILSTGKLEQVNNALKFNDLNSGVYFLRVIDIETNAFAVEKLVKL